MSRHKRMMDYCDGTLPGPYRAGPDTPREHLRADILALNDARNDAEAALAHARARLAEYKQGRCAVTDPPARGSTVVIRAFPPVPYWCVAHRGRLGWVDTRRDKLMPVYDGDRWFPLPGGRDDE